MDGDAPLIPVIKQTHLSKPPARHAGPVAAASVALLVVVSLAYWLDLGGTAHLLPAVPQAVFDRGEYWRVVTAIAAHADLGHLGANAVVFGVLTYLVFGYYGTLAYPVLTWLGGGVVTLLALSTYGPRTALVGASGVVYLMAGFWLTLYLLLERRLRFAKRLLRALGFGLIVLAPPTLEPLVSYRSHAIGLGVGIVLGIGYFVARKDALRGAERIAWE